MASSEIAKLICFVLFITRKLGATDIGIITHVTIVTYDHIFLKRGSRRFEDIFGRIRILL